MKKQKKILESGREAFKKEVQQQEERVCPECNGMATRSYEVRRGFGKRHVYTVYLCDCKTKWEIYNRTVKPQIEKPSCPGEVMAGLSTVGFFIFVIGLMCTVEGAFAWGIPMIAIGLPLFCLIFMVDAY